MSISFHKISDFKCERTIFSKLVYQTYSLIDFIGEDYEHLCEWYWSKAVPWVFSNHMDFFLALNSGKVIGVLIAKKEKEERKICTLFVSSEYSHKGIATHLINDSFEFLETTKPIITFSEYKIYQFMPIIRKYGWQIDEKRFKEFNKRYELICNTKIAK